jgi:hypothetical protein
LYTRKAPPLMRGLLGFGLLLLLPAFAMPMPPNWIEVRYLYPATVFWCPAVCAGLCPPRASRKPEAAAPRPRADLWFAGILTGSFYIQQRAREAGDRRCASAGSGSRSSAPLPGWRTPGR